jgi:hypothetical protein
MWQHRHPIFTIALVGFLALPSCKATKPRTYQQGQTGIESTWSGDMLWAEVPATVPATLSAANQTVRARGYSIERSLTDDHSGEIVCRPPRSTNFPRVNIDARSVGTRTRLTIRVVPWSDRDLCRSLLDGILERLAL